VLVCPTRRCIVQKYTCLPAALAIAAVLLAVSAGCGNGPPGGGSSVAIEAAPQFSVTTLDGRSYSLSDLKGRPVVLTFWASWCPACAQLAPRLDALYTTHQDDGLLVLGVAGADSEEDLTKKAESLKITYPIALSEEAVRAYGVHTIPMTFFIGRDGTLATSVMGAAPDGVLAEAVQKIL
jgi:cytochrome c biogenesis protein CcmG/thiol:disulfide interchange protein DsbE